MHRWITNDARLLFALCVLGIAACGSSSDSPADGGMNGTAQATCTFNKVTLVGDLDGQTVDVQVDQTGGVFQQFSLPYTMDTPFTGGMVHMEWTTLLPINHPAVSATGTIVMPAGAPHAGETFCGASGNVSETDPANTGAHVNQLFTLGTLSTGPTCPGVALAGHISGCVGG